MDAPHWRQQRPPSAPPVLFEGDVTTAADLTLLRAALHRQLLRRGLPPGADFDDVERLLLTFEELTSNGLRHGSAPVHVTVAQSEEGWLVDVSDSDTGRVPTPAVDRDPAQGGLGLFLVARLSAGFGWWTSVGRKHVWACVRPSTA